MKLKVIAQAKNDAAVMKSLTGDNSIKELIESVSSMLPDTQLQTKSDNDLDHDTDATKEHSSQNNFKM